MIIDGDVLMDRNYDLVIVGSGSAATSAAFYCSSNGLKTAVIDSKPFGGTCALRGCDPKKVLYGITESLHSADRLMGSGISQAELSIDWNSLISFKHGFTDPMPGNLQNSLEKAGIDSYNGHASFVSSNTLRVGENTLHANKILLASGAKAMDLGIAGQEHMLDNEQFMDMDELPENIVFVGGGYISVEFAGIASRSGSNSTIIHRGSRLLKSFDSDLAGKVLETLKSDGVNVLLNSEVKSIEKEGGKFLIHYSSEKGESTVKCDLVVHGSGREANFTGMDIDKGSIEADRNGVLVNEYMQSNSNPNVYAAGDCASTQGMKLTPVANIEGEAAAYNIVHGNSKTPDYRAIPTVVFSSPPLSMVGLTEDQASKIGRKVNVKSGDTSGWYNSRRKKIENTAYKILTDTVTGEIVGAHILGDNSEEAINVFSLAMRYGIKPEDLRNYPFAYPSDTTEIRYML